MATPYNTRKLHLEVDGINVTGILNIPNTGGFQAWQTVTVPNIALTQGDHVITLYFDENDINVNKMEFILSGITAPVADFEFTPQMGCVNETVTFTSVSVGSIDTYSWNFGEGAQPATATGIGPHSVTYSTEGDKEVSLTVSNSEGSNTKDVTYMVHDCHLGVENPNAESNKITVYPNPSKGIFHLSKELEWSVYSVSGSKIKQGSGNVISISDQAAGIYFIKKQNLPVKQSK